MRYLWMALGMTVGASVPVDAQDFSGTVEVRTVSADAGAVAALLDLAEAREAPPDRILSVTSEQVLALVEAGREGATAESTSYRIRGSLLRLDVAEGYIVMDLANEVFRMVDPSSKSYMEFTRAQLDMINQSMQGQMGDTDADAEPVVRETGRTARINGVMATQYDVEMSDELVRGWVTDEHADLVASMRAVVELSPSNDREGNGFAAIVDRGLPIRITSYHPDRGALEIADIVSVVREEHADDVFDMPPGYTKQVMPGM